MDSFAAEVNIGHQAQNGVIFHAGPNKGSGILPMDGLQREPPRPVIAVALVQFLGIRPDEKLLLRIAALASIQPPPQVPKNKINLAFPRSELDRRK